MRTKLSVCRRKRDYPSSAAALDEAARIGLPLRPYRCDRCRRFHLTGRLKGKWVASAVRAHHPASAAAAPCPPPIRPAPVDGDMAVRAIDRP